KEKGGRRKEEGESRGSSLQSPISSLVFSGFRQRRAERLPFRQPLVQPLQRRMRGAPLDFGQRLVEIIERVAGADIGQREPAADTEFARAEILLHDGEAAVYLGSLAPEPVRRALLLLRLPVLVVDVHGSLCNTVAQRLPALDFEPLVRGLGNEA